MRGSDHCLIAHLLLYFLSRRTGYRILAMKQVVIIGCGVVGAMIAYELSELPGWQVTVVDRQMPAQGATQAALGVLMGIISQKVKGRAWAMRQSSIQRYATLLPELEAAIGTSLPWNQQGILKFCFPEDDLQRWQDLAELRHNQNWQLEIWDRAQVQTRCPQVQHPDFTAAIYSPQDYQIDPTVLTQALVKAAEQRGVHFHFDVQVEAFDPIAQTGQHCDRLHTSIGDIAADWIVIAAGLGSTPLTQSLNTAVQVGPVLGQAMQIRLDQPLGHPDFQPVITGRDIHIVPIGQQDSQQDYWVGATVEFPGNEASLQPEAAALETVWQGAITLCPDLAKATVLKTWSGLRPRPVNRPAPIVEPLAGYDNVFLATGHYRNGILLAPATAQLVRSALTAA